MTATSVPGLRQPDEVPAVTALVERLAAAFDDRDASAFGSLFHPEGAWRDILAFTWHFRTTTGPEAISSEIAAVIERVAPTGLDLLSDTPIRDVERAGRSVIEVLLRFETSIGPCRAVARLRNDAGSLSLWSFTTSLDQIRGHEEAWTGVADESRDPADFGGDNWLDRRTKHAEFIDHEPDVLVVGAGQCGLAMAARLGQLGLDALIVENHPRVGDSWRKRYHALTLHNRTATGHFPYLPFPLTFPVWLAKDKLANWMEFYADAMDLSVWTSTTFTGATFDESAGRWDVVVHRDGTERRIRPKHIVMATGISGKPHIPDLPGLDAFEGEVIHSGAYSRGTDYADKRAIILGIGNSAHDVAQDLHGAGAAEVTMFQRGPTTVVSVESGNVVYGLYHEGLTLELCDLLITATPYRGVVEGFQAVVEYCEVADADLQVGLAKAGMKLDWGHDRTGFQMKYMRRGGGYYLNVGCSELIMDGKVKLRHFEEFDRIVPEGIRLNDGSTLPADLLVMGTGYHSLQDLVGTVFGDDVADKVGPIWGWDAEGELANMYKRTNQENLWFLAGSLTQSRVMSKVVALQIKARELGLIDAAPPARVAGDVLTAADR